MDFVTRFSRLFGVLTTLAATGLSPARAQTQTPEADALTHADSLGAEYVAVTGTPVLFAKFETRVSDWEVFVKDAGYAWDYRPPFEQGKDHPVVGITVQDARAYCSWLTEKERKAGKLKPTQAYRLPTVEEWDAAVGLSLAPRGSLTVDEKIAEEKRLPWGETWPPPANAGNFSAPDIPGYHDDYVYTSPAGKFTPSGDGVYDLSGNVWEWCWNPVLAAPQTATLRGGSWAYFRRECLTAAYRYEVPVDLRMPTVGFRCVYEDRDRTTTLLAAAKVADSKAREQRRSETLGSGDVDPAAVIALKKSLAAGDSQADLPNPSTLTPATAGKRFVNALGMEFLPQSGGSGLVGATEVRAQDFEAWLRDSRREWPNKPPFKVGASHPAPGVTWVEARAFCEWLTAKDLATKLIPAGAKYRLPTDVEWSRAAGLDNESGADPAQRDHSNKTHYPWSALGIFPPRALSVNLDAARIPGYNDSYAYTGPVSAELPSETGIRGLGGNVAEWCEDEWPGAPGEHVIRGGSWQSYDPNLLLTSARRHAPADRGLIDVGFRCVLDLPSSNP